MAIASYFLGKFKGGARLPQWQPMATCGIVKWDENGLAGLSLLEALSGARVRHAGLCDRGDADGLRVSDRNKTGPRRSHWAAPPGEAFPAGPARRGSSVSAKRA